MLVVDPDKRLNIKSILTHKWMSGVEVVSSLDSRITIDVNTLNPMVLEHMLTLPGLDHDIILKVSFIASKKQRRRHLLNNLIFPVRPKRYVRSR